MGYGGDTTFIKGAVFHSRLKMKEAVWSLRRTISYLTLHTGEFPTVPEGGSVTAPVYRGHLDRRPHVHAAPENDVGGVEAPEQKQDGQVSASHRAGGERVRGALHYVVIFESLFEFFMR